MLPKINLVVVGHKDHGKSTLIGRLLYDSKAIPESKLQEIQTELDKSGKKGFEFAFLLDSLEEERQGGLTIDITQMPFKSKKYFYTIIDCPGHREFIKKMFTGASQADASVLVVSAKEGIQDQTKQHAFLIKTLGIRQMVVAVNKMDELNYEETKFQQMVERLKPFLASLGFTGAPIVPISALKGENVFSKSDKMPWYAGSTLIKTLDDNISIPEAPINKPLRACVQDVYKQESNVTIVCKVVTGTLEVSKTVSFLPSGKVGKVKAIEVFGNNPEKAMPGDSVGLIIEGISDVERGEVMSYPENPAKIAKTFTAEIILFTNTEIKTGEVHTIRVGTAEKKCRIDQIINEIDPLNLTIIASSQNIMKGGGVGEVKFSAMEPLCLEKHSDFPPLGRFVIEGKKGPIGAGIVSNFEYMDSG
jgi:elongation factor 1-alpha